MGQARNLKGKTYKERVAFAKDRDRKAAEERERKHREWWESLTDDERKAIMEERRERARADAKFHETMAFFGGLLVKSVLPYRIK
jgi:hypothetical protein